MTQPYQSREPVPYGIYHIFHRGVERRQVFLDGYDYRHCLRLLRKGLEREPTVSILAYALMPNHYHLVLRQGDDARAVGRFMQRIEASYVKRFNARHRHAGPVLEGRYNSDRVVGAQHLMDVSRYVHLNPLEAGLGWQQSKYSSIDAYIPPFLQNSLVDTKPVLELWDVPGDYERFMFAKWKRRKP